jgi:hypothetical protein
MLLLLLVMTTVATSGAVDWKAERNTNAVYSRLTNGPGKDVGDIK